MATGFGTAGFIPTIWSPRKIGRPVSTARGALFTFNEPDMASQANTTPAEAVEAWPELVACYPNHSLIAPTISQFGIEWLVEWMALMEEARLHRSVHGLSWNIYGTLGEAENMAWKVTDMGAAWGLDLYVNKEFNFPDLNDVLAYSRFCELRRIAYAWFVMRVPPERRTDRAYGFPLVEEDGTLTEHGRLYRRLPLGGAWA
jgi:hypothetical protein